MKKYRVLEVYDEEAFYVKSFWFKSNAVKYLKTLKEKNPNIDFTIAIKRSI